MIDNFKENLSLKETNWSQWCQQNITECNKECLTDLDVLKNKCPILLEMVKKNNELLKDNIKLEIDNTLLNTKNSELTDKTIELNNDIENNNNDLKDAKNKLNELLNNTQELIDNKETFISRLPSVLLQKNKEHFDVEEVTNTLDEIRKDYNKIVDLKYVQTETQLQNIRDYINNVKNYKLATKRLYFIIKVVLVAILLFIPIAMFL